MHWLVTSNWDTDKTVAVSAHAVFRPRCESLTSRMDHRSGCTALCSGGGSGGGSPKFDRTEPISPPRRSEWELNAGKSDAAVFLVNYHSASVLCSEGCYHPADGRSSTKTQISPTINDNWPANWSQENSFVFHVSHSLSRRSKTCSTNPSALVKSFQWRWGTRSVCCHRPTPFHIRYHFISFFHRV